MFSARRELHSVLNIPIQNFEFLRYIGLSVFLSGSCNETVVISFKASHLDYFK